MNNEGNANLYLFASFGFSLEALFKLSLAIVFSNCFRFAQNITIIVKWLRLNRESVCLLNYRYNRRRPYYLRVKCSTFLFYWTQQFKDSK